MGLMEALEEKDITMMTNKEAREINKKSIIVTDKRTGEEQSIEGDTIVVALGSKSVSSIAGELEGKVPVVLTQGAQRYYRWWAENSAINRQDSLGDGVMKQKT